VKRIQKLGDIGNGALCVESAYPVAMAFVKRVRVMRAGVYKRCASPWHAN
jgi:hypothetical protein